MTIRIAIIGYGKIARDQHVPAITGNPDFQLVGIVDPVARPDLPAPRFATLAALQQALPGQVDAVAICTPPQFRQALAIAAMATGCAVLLEKPPAATLGDVATLVAMAAATQQSLYAAWHSQHAAAVAPARACLVGATISSLAIEWREDVHKWHGGQDWVWAPGGFGVFDPGINALSIATAILPMPLCVNSAVLHIPANRQTAIAATLEFGSSDFTADFDWRHQGNECWNITVTTSTGCRMVIANGGSTLTIDGVAQPLPQTAEYASIYRRFAELVAQGGIEIDSEPLRIVADANLLGGRRPEPAFDWADR